MTDRHTLLRMLAGAIALALATTAMARDGQAVGNNDRWDAPFDVQLPPPARQIRLPAATDAAQWARAQGLGEFRTLYRSPDGAILETRMTEEDWTSFQDRACTGGVSCETAACQSIQFQGDVSTGDGAGPQTVEARLVHRAPEHVPVDDDPTADAGSCRTPVVVAGLDDAVPPGPGQNVTINLEVRGASESSGGAAPAPAAPEPAAPEPAAPGAVPPTDVAATTPGGGAPANADASTQPAGGDGNAPVGSGSEGEGDTGAAETGQAPASAVRRSFQFAIDRGFNALGGASLDAGKVPADTTDWSLVVSAGCSDVEIPLDALEPAHVPGQVVALVEGGTSAAVAATYNLVVLRDITLDSTDESLTVFAGADNVAAVAAAMLLDPRVSAAQPEFVYRTSAEYGDGDPDAPAPAGYSDPFAAMSYGPRLTGALSLHPAARGGGQLVAVIDTGVDAAHPELDQRLADTVDVTDRGYSADLHGTAVAGIIAANANNAQGSYGVAPNAEILAIKACQPVEEGALRAKCWSSTLVKALDLAMSRDARIINMSLAGPPDDLVARYVNLAVSQDRLVVAASGNNGPQGRPGYPAALPAVLAVTAVDALERHYPEANVGDYIDVSAPGVDIISPVPGGSYPPLSGTSMAAAHVSGAAALLAELSPFSSGRELGALLKARTRDLGDPGTDALFGTGLVDACSAAVQATAQAVSCATQGGDHAP